MTSPNLHRVMPTQIWCLSVTNPKLVLSHPISALLFSPSSVDRSFTGLERTIESKTIPYSLPVLVYTYVHVAYLHMNPIFTGGVCAYNILHTITIYQLKHSALVIRVNTPWLSVMVLTGMVLKFFL